VPTFAAAGSPRNSPLCRSADSPLRPALVPRCLDSVRTCPLTVLAARCGRSDRGRRRRGTIGRSADRNAGGKHHHGRRARAVAPITRTAAALHTPRETSRIRMCAWPTAGPAPAAAATGRRDPRTSGETCDEGAGMVPARGVVGDRRIPGKRRAASAGFPRGPRRRRPVRRGLDRGAGPRDASASAGRDTGPHRAVGQVLRAARGRRRPRAAGAEQAAAADVCPRPAGAAGRDPRLG
jgi:hypothetical protein